MHVYDVDRKQLADERQFELSEVLLEVLGYGPLGPGGSRIQVIERKLIVDPYDCHPKRIILTPYEDMEATVAASVWGWTWTADCFDGEAEASLAEFIDDHWLDPTLGPEDDVCGGGSILPGNLP